MDELSHLDTKTSETEYCGSAQEQGDSTIRILSCSVPQSPKKRCSGPARKPPEDTDAQRWLARSQPRAGALGPAKGCEGYPSHENAYVVDVSIRIYAYAELGLYYIKEFKGHFSGLPPRHANAQVQAGLEILDVPLILYSLLPFGTNTFRRPISLMRSQNS
jgi:hypothetical protein